MHPTLKARAKLHKQIHEQKKADPAYQKMTPTAKFAHVAKHVSAAMKKQGC